jgi:hypothetical protein
MSDLKISRPVGNTKINDARTPEEVAGAGEVPAAPQAPQNVTPTTFDPNQAEIAAGVKGATAFQAVRDSVRNASSAVGSGLTTAGSAVNSVTGGATTAVSNSLSAPVKSALEVGASWAGIADRGGSTIRTIIDDAKATGKGLDAAMKYEGNLPSFLTKLTPAAKALTGMNALASGYKAVANLGDRLNDVGNAFSNPSAESLGNAGRAIANETKDVSSVAGAAVKLGGKVLGKFAAPLATAAAVSDFADAVKMQNDPNASWKKKAASWTNAAGSGLSAAASWAGPAGLPFNVAGMLISGAATAVGAYVN